MKKMLIAVDMQNDFVNGVLGTIEARTIVPYVCQKINQYKNNNDIVMLTKDIHGSDYNKTQEGQHIPLHCQADSHGQEFIDELDTFGCIITSKCSFTSVELAKQIADVVKKENIKEIEICGLCTDICVISNALMVKAALPEILISVDAKACAGTTEVKHMAALSVLESCQVLVKNK